MDAKHNHKQLNIWQFFCDFTNSTSNQNRLNTVLGTEEYALL